MLRAGRGGRLEDREVWETQLVALQVGAAAGCGLQLRRPGGAVGGAAAQPTQVARGLATGKGKPFTWLCSRGSWHVLGALALGCICSAAC